MSLFGKIGNVRRNMIVVELQGGLGNQMFQYATARALALHQNRPLYIDKSGFEEYKLHDYGLHNLNISASYHEEPKGILNKLQDKLTTKVRYEEGSLRYAREVFDLKAQKIFLKGYFQTEKYFSKYRTEILQEFKVVSNLKEETIALLKTIEGTNAVSIHIRRGDYVNHSIHDSCTAEYYNKAMALVESRIESPVYFVFSDDINWVKENFSPKFKTYYVDFNDAKTNYEDLKLMASCKHNIIANSSFSWWGAWLNTHKNKIVIAPEKWFNVATLDYTDIVPESWVKL